MLVWCFSSLLHQHLRFEFENGKLLTVKIFFQVGQLLLQLLVFLFKLVAVNLKFRPQCHYSLFGDWNWMVSRPRWRQSLSTHRIVCATCLHWFLEARRHWMWLKESALHAPDPELYYSTVIIAFHDFEWEATSDRCWRTQTRSVSLSVVVSVRRPLGLAEFRTLRKQSALHEDATTERTHRTSRNSMPATRITTFNVSNPLRQGASHGGRAT